MDRGYDLGWLSRNATSISDTEKKREGFIKVCEDVRESEIVTYYLDQAGEYRYDKRKK